MSERPLSIVHIAAPAPVGGLERVVQALAAGQRAAGHRVTVLAVLAPHERRHPFVGRLRDDGVEVEEIFITAKQYLRERREVRRLLRAIRPDVAHTHGYRCDLLDGAVARGLGIPIVSTLHGSSRLGGKSHFFEWLQLRAFRRFDAVVAVSQPLERMLLDAGVGGSRIAVIPNGWPGIEPRFTRDEARRRLGVPADGFVVGFVGRLIRVKGADVLLRALASLEDRSWRVVLVGDGGERTMLAELAAAEGLTDRVTFAGHLDEATHLYPAFDAYVLSSRTEGTPIALFEAMAARVPIIATTVGGVGDVVRTAEALLIEPESPDAMAGAISAVRRDPAAATRRASAARERLETAFGTVTWLARHELLYRRLAGSREARRHD